MDDKVLEAQAQAQEWLHQFQPLKGALDHLLLGQGTLGCRPLSQPAMATLEHTLPFGACKRKALPRKRCAPNTQSKVRIHDKFQVGKSFWYEHYYQ